MKICWDNLDKLRYSKKTKKWYKGNNTFYYKDECEVCKEPFLTQNKNGNVCSVQCSANTEKNKKQAAENLRKSMTGKPKSDEVRKKISESRKGQHSGENNPMYGNGHRISGEKNGNYGKKGCLNHNYGKKRPKHSLKMLGKGNPNWIDGKSFEPYCEVWKDKEYKKYIKERDNNKCQNPLCRKITEKLCIHHIDYDKKNCVPSNLITVCFSCNVRANFNRDFWEKHYKNIMK